MNDKNLVLATSSVERLQVLRKQYSLNSSESIIALDEWKNKKSIVKEEQFQYMLLANDITADEFGIGIKKLNNTDIELLYQFIQNEEWYILHREIMNTITETSLNVDSETDGLKLFTRPYIMFFIKKMEIVASESLILVSETVIPQLAESFYKELSSIILKTIIYDQNETEYPCKPDENNLKCYMAYRFSNLEGYNEFFNDYPVLARLLSNRTQYIINNLREFIKTLEKEKEKCRELYELEGELRLRSINIDNGDSHQKGKAVIVFVLNNKKLVFKYKNLVIGDKLNDMFTLLENLNPLLFFYKIKRILGPTYSIEEFIEYKQSITEEDIKLFYKRFGYLVCLTYTLCGNDFHMENLIALKDCPVLIDVETLIQNRTAVRDNGTAKYQISLENSNSIMGTSLLPSIYSNIKSEKMIEFSALTGSEQVLPFKVLALAEKSSSKMRLEYQEATRKGADNLPILNGEKVSYLNYSKEIIEGFAEVYNTILENREVLINHIKTLFSGVLVRNVLKSTQKYVEMLDYGYHPSYMTNYINREKLFENIWAYAYENPSVVKYEIKDMLENDIPIFYNVTDQEYIITSDNSKINNFYSSNSLGYVLKRILEFSKDHLIVQQRYLKTALGLYQGDLTKFSFSVDKAQKTNNLVKAKQIVDYILDSIIWGSDKQDVALPVYVLTEDKIWKKNFMTNDFYNGFSGIYMLLYQLVRIFPEKKYYEILHVLDKMFFEKLSSIKNSQQYADYLGILYVISEKIEILNNIKDIFIGKKVLEEIKEYYLKENFKNDWLFGRAGLINVCIKFYQSSGLSIALEFAFKLADDIHVINKEESGFAHGTSGILFSLLCLLEFSTKENRESIENKIHKYYELLDYSLNSQDIDNASNSWCKGLVGVCYTLLKYYETCGELPLNGISKLYNIIEKIIERKLKDDCLCHGNFGELGILNRLLSCTLVSEKDKYNISNKIKGILNRQYYYLRGLDGETSLDLMTGLAGIAYEYLRNNDPKIHNILIFE